jgi:predicted ArsR family transcriptional regulator
MTETEKTAMTSSEAPHALDVLHALRVKGIATPESLADALGVPPETIETRLAALDADGLAFERPSRKRPGWVVSETGRDAHAEWLAAGAGDATRTQLDEHYQRFLAVNAEVKGLAARWQAATDGAERFDLTERLETAHEQAVPALEQAGAVVARYGRYPQRLQEALDKIQDDPRYFVSPRVDSYHTIWFECHEDFLLTLGRTRAEEGSE